MVAGVEQLGGVGQADGGEEEGGVVAGGVNLAACDSIAPAVEEIVAGVFGPSLGQPAGGKIGQGGVQLPAEGGGGLPRLAGQGVEGGVGPVNLIVGDGHDRHGEWHLGAESGVQSGEGGLNIAVELPAAAGGKAALNEEEDDRGNALRGSERVDTEPSRKTGEEQERERTQESVEGEGFRRRRNHSETAPFC